MLFNEKNDRYAIKRLFIFGPHEEEEKMDYSNQNIEAILRTEILERIIDIFLINDRDQRWPDLPLMFEPKFVKFIISSDIAEHARTKSLIPDHLNKLNKCIAECYRPLVYTTKYNLVEENGYSSFTPLCGIDTSSIESAMNYIDLSKRAVDSDRRIFPIFDDKHKHIYILAVFFESGKMSKCTSYYCLTLDQFLNTHEYTAGITYNILKSNNIVSYCSVIEPTGLQEDSYRCSLFAFEHLRKMLTISYTNVAKFIRFYEERYAEQLNRGNSFIDNYNEEDLRNEIIATTTEKTIAMQKKMLDYLTDIALDLLSSLHPELLALQGEAEKGGALTTLLESYLFPLCLKVEIKDPAGLAERIAKEIVYETEINQAGTKVSSTTVKAGLLKKLEASTTVSWQRFQMLCRR